MQPGRLYDGEELERIEPETLELLVQELEQRTGKLRVGAGRMGVLTWDIACESADGPFVLQVPRRLDQPSRHGRAVRDVPRQNLENMRYFRERGLSRFVSEPRELLSLGGGVPVALFDALPAYRALSFGRGAIQVELADGKHGTQIGLGPAATADVLAELVAALVYHYEPELAGGTIIADVCVNDGDFAIRRNSNGSFELRMTAVRRRESGVDRNLLILYLMQLLAYEDWTVDGNLTGVPTLISNPAIVIHGLSRGLRYRARDLGIEEARGATEAMTWINDFGRSREGRAYRPWLDHFLSGEYLPLTFGDDLRERWWRVIPLETKYGLLELRARRDANSSEASSARAMRSFLDRLAREVGRTPKSDTNQWRINDATRDELERWLTEAQVPAETRGTVAERLLAQWPFRSLDHLLALVPEARAFRRMKSRIDFGTVVAEADQGTLRSLAPLDEHAPARPIANREIFGSLSLPESLAARAVETFPSFEAYMDSALHDPRWGYYARHVVIGQGGHFATHPELFSPNYGRWIANWAFKAWRDLIAHGELSTSDTFPIIEFGAGNGRLARDVLDAISANVAQAGDWAIFAQRARYQIYETSESLRAKQRELLGEQATISVGDARRPAETLQRDFPAGVRGFIVTNEVPDAFGVHKVVLNADGVASVALVLARAESTLLEVVSAALAGKIREINETIRHAFGFARYRDDFYLDQRTLFELLESLQGDEARLGSLWFEETYVPVSTIPALAEQLAANASDYALALAAEDSGVVLYVNVHAARFMRELGSCMAAGIIVTIDYGNTTFGLVQGARRGDFPFRVYRDSADYRPRPNDPYAAPGTQDMTADVNFSELARAGCDAGLRLIHFGPERDVSGDELPELLRAANEHQSFATFLGNPVFKVLVLGTRESAAFSGPLATSLPLSRREQDIPKARRHKLASIEQALQRGGIHHM